MRRRHLNKWAFFRSLGFYLPCWLCVKRDSNSFAFNLGR
jgi:hypothetical protein